MLQTVIDNLSVTSAEDLLVHPDPLHIPYEAVQACQMAWLRQSFAVNRERIPALQRVAEHKGIVSIERLADLIPLLFSHTTYKSYPELFLDKNQWGHMNRWLAAFTTRSDEIKRIDVSGVSTIDDWLALLDNHGFAICYSSGTTGKPSFFPRSASEMKLVGRASCTAIKLGYGVDAECDKMPFLCISFASGWSNIIRINQEFSRAYSPSADTIEFAFNETLSPESTRQQQKLRKLAAEGKLLPDEFDRFQKISRQREQANAEAFQDFVRRTLKYRGQRIMLHGHRATVYRLAAQGSEMGLTKVFSPDSLILHGGGSKEAALPEDYEDRMARYFGVEPRNIADLYGMTERGSIPVNCEYGRKHCPPWEIPLILSPGGAKLLNPEGSDGGTVIGQYAFFDLLASTYWGGVITGDRVKVSFDPCPCGREGPQILEIARYQNLSQIPDADKLSCAAEMTSYVLADSGR